MLTAKTFTISEIAKNYELRTLFSKRYRSNYSMIYDLGDNVKELDKAEEAAEQWLKEVTDRKSNPCWLIAITEDSCISDREVRALGFTLQEFGIVKFKK